MSRPPSRNIQIGESCLYQISRKSLAVLAFLNFVENEVFFPRVVLYYSGPVSKSKLLVVYTCRVRSPIIGRSNYWTGQFFSCVSCLWFSENTCEKKCSSWSLPVGTIEPGGLPAESTSVVFLNLFCSLRSCSTFFVLYVLSRTCIVQVSLER